MRDPQAPRLTVIGAGSYGTALAICFARNGVETLLWGRNPKQMLAMQASRCNQQYLPDARFPDSLSVTTDLSAAMAFGDNILVVVPSHGFRDTLTAIQPLITEQHRLAWATKGLDPQSGGLLQDVARQVLGETISLAVLSGPTFAREMAAGLPTAISIASTSEAFADDLAAMLHCDKRFRVYKNNDFIGIQLGGAVKNVIAIGAGLADGIGFGANARTALITRGMAEMTRLGAALGARPETFMGMSGLGDLVLTCTDNQSRNRRFGLALGEGKDVDTAMADIGQVVEGYRNTKEVFMLANRYNVEMPITEQIYQVLYQQKCPKDAALALLGRAVKVET